VDPVAVMAKHLYAEPASLSLVRRDLQFSNEIEQVLAKAMAKDCARRYQSMRQFKEALIQIKANTRSGDNWWQKLNKKLKG
jgi:hypothetical protein